MLGRAERDGARRRDRPPARGFRPRPVSGRGDARPRGQCRRRRGQRHRRRLRGDRGDAAYDAARRAGGPGAGPQGPTTSPRSRRSTASSGTGRARAAAGRRCSWSSRSSRSRPWRSGGPSCDERAEPRARDAAPGRSRRLDGLRERVDLRARDGRLRLAALGGAAGRDLPRRPRRRALDGARRRPDAAAARRAHLRDRARLRLPDRTGGRPSPARLDRGRCRRLRARALLAALRLPRPRALQVRLRDLGDRAADAPVGAGARAARQRRQALGRHRAAALPAGRDREDLPRHLPCGLPPRQARGARARTAQGLRAAPRDLGRRHARARPDERPRLGAPQLRDLPRDGVRGNRPPVLRPRRPRSLRGRVGAPLRLTVPRPAARHRLAAAVDRREGPLLDQRPARVPPELRLVPARQEPLLDRERRLRRAPGSAVGRSRRSTGRR